MKQTAFTLLEVILALAILGGAMAILGEVARLSLQNATTTRDLARGQLLAETKMSEIASGLVSADSVSKTPFDTSTEGLDKEDTGWVYSVDQQSSDQLQQGLLCVKVTVSRNVPDAQHPPTFSLTGWVPDPNFVPETVPSGGTSTSTSSGTSNGGSNGQ
jgi:prepilin-type N-terminal cleavage/methylation domain-containing protein